MQTINDGAAIQNRQGDVHCARHLVADRFKGSARAVAWYFAVLARRCRILPSCSAPLRASLAVELC